MNILLRELKANRKALMIWCACMLVGVWSGMTKYTAYSSDPQAGDIFNDLPDSMKALIGMGSFDVTQMSGYFAMLIGYIGLALAIHAALLGAGIIAREERDKTTEFLMIKPVSRFTVITSKFLAGFINIFVLNVFTFVSSLLMTASYNKGADVSGEVAIFYASLFFVQLIFFTLGAALAALLRNPKPSGSLTAGILFASFIIAKITDLTDNVDFLNIFSPFKYFNMEKIVAGDGLSPMIVLLSLLPVVVFTLSTYFFYKKRDLHI